MTVEKKLNWAILVTGWGRNAKDTIEAFKNNKLKQSNISLVVYEEEPCGAKDLAESYQIETIKILKSDFKNIVAYQAFVIQEIKKRDIDYIFMLNYKYIIKDEMLKAFPNRILNIHPSLFPSFLGTKTAIQDALDYGVKVTGITTHIIDEKIDEGTILRQHPIKVKANDTFDSLYPKFAKAGQKIILKTIKTIENKHFKN
ncbi:formyltransferase family protein [Formosa algae]|uniref:phosphoribosylglycinamide formyltransferase 1 n=1 Tax=Formosa algae TaxID=225843 RepID=A0A9X0YL13_9FLAO|nr:formyltransferase family protein [Formosa algae]MBP1841020.1 phosphoribosylglycinamide formyltransferase-1 [Formosa algae]MDQ0336560.1 phosphoribosylglycinamide formyltransferase-1 [Formosa algae]OEI81518.1 phosphoribosylglycinamide formyltransferase [Formosa algae]